MAGDAVLTTRRRFPDANVQLDLSEDILFLPMEPMLIKQVIVNLLENAVRHSGDTQHIQLHLFRQEEWAVVEVRTMALDCLLTSCRQSSPAVPSPGPVRRLHPRHGHQPVRLPEHHQSPRRLLAAGNDPEGGAVFRFGLPMEEKAYGENV